MAHNDLSDAIGRLTSREREVLFLISEGLKVKEVASATNISVNTVRNHIKSAKIKTSVSKICDIKIKVSVPEEISE